MTRLPFDDGHTPLTDANRDGLIPANLVVRAELNQWEALNIVRAQRWLASRRRTDVLTDAFLHALPMLIRDLLENTRARFDASAKNETELDNIAALFHHELVRIHPWPNGTCGAPIRAITRRSASSAGASFPRAQAAQASALSAAR